MFECETGPEEQAGSDTPALQNQLGLGAKQERSRLEQPSRRRQADANAPGAAQGRHEFGVRQRIGRGHVDRTRKVIAIRDPVDRADKITVVNPGDILPAVARPPTQAIPHQSQQRVERPAALGTHDDRGAQFDLARQRSVGLIECAFPRLRYVGAETPCVAANDSVLIVSGIEPMSVDGGGAHLQPEAGRPDRARDRFADHASGVDTRFHDFPPVARVVTAVDISPREVDDDVGTRQLGRP